LGSAESLLKIIIVNLEVTIRGLVTLLLNILHDNLIGKIARTECKISKRKDADPKAVD